MCLCACTTGMLLADTPHVHTHAPRASIISVVLRGSQTPPNNNRSDEWMASAHSHKADAARHSTEDEGGAINAHIIRLMKRNTSTSSMVAFRFFVCEPTRLRTIERAEDLVCLL